MGIYKKSIEKTQHEIAGILAWRSIHRDERGIRIRQEKKTRGKRLYQLRKKLKGMLINQQHIKARAAYTVPLINHKAFVCEIRSEGGGAGSRGQAESGSHRNLKCNQPEKLRQIQTRLEREGAANCSPSLNHV